MTAEPILVGTPRGAQADETVRRSIKALIHARGLDKREVADAVGMTRTTLYRRLAGHGSNQPFTAGEVAALADYFDVEIEALFSGLGGAVAAPLDAAERRADGRGARRNAAVLPRMDSNHQPADYAPLSTLIEPSTAARPFGRFGHPEFGSGASTSRAAAA